MNATKGAFSVTVDKERASVDEQATRNSRYPIPVTRSKNQKAPVFGSLLIFRVTGIEPVTAKQAAFQQKGGAGERR